MERLLHLFDRPQHPGIQNKLAKYVVETVDKGQSLINCAKSCVVGPNHPRVRGGIELKCEIDLVNLNHGYVVVTYELVQ